MSTINIAQQRTSTSLRRVWVAFCERCQWVGGAHVDDSPPYGKYKSAANEHTRGELGRHYDQYRHHLDGPHKDGDNIHSVGVEEMAVRDLTLSEKLHAVIR